MAPVHAGAQTAQLVRLHPLKCDAVENNNQCDQDVCRTRAAYRFHLWSSAHAEGRPGNSARWTGGQAAWLPARLRVRRPTLPGSCRRPVTSGLSQRRSTSPHRSRARGHAAEFGAGDADGAGAGDGLRPGPDRARCILPTVPVPPACALENPSAGKAKPCERRVALP